MIKNLWEGEKYTTDELNARLKFFIGIILGLTLFGIVFVVLYSLIFVTQPTNKISPVDAKFFELIIPIATFLTGTLSGIMLAGDDKDLKAKALDAANKPYVPPPPPPPEPTTVAAPKPFSPAGFGGTPLGGNTMSAAPIASMPMAPMGGFGGSFAPTDIQMVNGKPAPVQPDHPEI